MVATQGRNHGPGCPHYPGCSHLRYDGTTGLFTSKILVRTYVDNAGGLRVGAPVRLEGVDIGNVSKIRVISDVHHAGLRRSKITMKITN